MSEIASAAEGFLIRAKKSGSDGPAGIEVCKITEGLAETGPSPSSCTLFPEGTTAFAVAEMLLELIGVDSDGESALPLAQEPGALP